MELVQSLSFLRMACAQGVEVEREVVPGRSYLLRCEPRIWHWCGEDHIAAHFENLNLSLLLVVAGYASFDPQSGGLSDTERGQFAAAERAAACRVGINGCVVPLPGISAGTAPAVRASTLWFHPVQGIATGHAGQFDDEMNALAVGHPRL